MYGFDRLINKPEMTITFGLCSCILFGKSYMMVFVIGYRELSSVIRQLTTLLLSHIMIINNITYTSLIKLSCRY